MATRQVAAAGLAFTVMLGPTYALADMSACQYAYEAKNPKDKIRGYSICLVKGGNGASRDAQIYTMRGLAYADMRDFDDALLDYTQAIEANPAIDAAYILRGEIYANRGDWDKAQADFGVAASRPLASQNRSMALAHEAWLFATWPDASKRDGPKGVGLAKESTRLRDYASNHDVLAAAYAEGGQFDDAVREEAKAIDHIQHDKDRRVLPDYEARMVLYRMGAPYHSATPFPRTSGGRAA